MTFEGLRQCLYQPEERVYVGTIPPALDRARKNEKLNIANITVKKMENAKNTAENWFDADINLNSGLVTVIGNKGSGKSAFSDIVGHLCKASSMEKASFLNPARFRKMPKNYAGDYMAGIIWADGHKGSILLSDASYQTTIEDAQYLPQKYIEDVCNDIENEFQNEINKVIFSYVDQTERGNAKNLDELVENKAKAVYLTIDKIREEINSVNKKIIGLEDRKTSWHITNVKDSLKKLEEDLARHDSSKPAEISKPEEKEEDKEYQEQLLNANSAIEHIRLLIEEKRNELTEINIKLDETNQLISRIQLLENNVAEVNLMLQTFMIKNGLEELKEITLYSPIEGLRAYILRLAEKKSEISALMNGDKENDGLIYNLREAEERKAALISSADAREKKYQKYLQDLSDWEKERKRILGDGYRDNGISS